MELKGETFTVEKGTGNSDIDALHLVIKTDDLCVKTDKDIEIKEEIDIKAEIIDPRLETDCFHVHQETIYIKEEPLDVKIETTDLKEGIKNSSTCLFVETAGAKEETMEQEIDLKNPIDIKIAEDEVKDKNEDKIVGQETHNDSSKATQQPKSVYQYSNQYSNLSMEIFKKSIIGKRINITNAPHACKQCEFRSNEKQELELHIRTSHINSSGNNVYSLNYYNSKQKRNLDIHVGVHFRVNNQKINREQVNISYNCNQCDFQSKYKRNLKMHIKLKHDNTNKEILYRCYLCDYSAKQKEDLKLHLEARHENLAYPCDQCDYKSTEENNLKTHRKIVHKNGSNSDHQSEYTGKRFFCEECPKSFTNNHALNYHKRNHTGEKPYICDVCLQTFTSKWTLEEHKLIHTGEMPFQCDHCEKSFRRVRDMRVHKKRIHSSDPSKTNKHNSDK